MKDARNASVLLPHFQQVQSQALQARSLLDRASLAADAVYDLRLSLRICRILRHFVRKDPDFDQWSPVFDQCYRATSPVRDHQVGIGLIRQLECGWPRNRRRPSTALARALRQSYPLLGGEMDRLGLPQALAAMQAAIEQIERQASPKKLIKRAGHHADRLAVALGTRMRTALARHRIKDWHNLRLAIKHYRFWVGALEDVLSAEHAARARALKPLQVALGEAHDNEVLARWLPEVPGVPLDVWQLALSERKQVDLARAMTLLTPLLASHGLADLANGIS
ncbi:CHAD domain-containing protein [Paludibacterium purpuratum]|uniref:CHAD domain-containing protein n=1 Tax=Paludibacterium purpuratum TaxID=1144873 RepID=A0A4R7BDA9_9NEIS|nr:CHAD domain-containing protein [Paludibacterium purpuratum]TDR81945.1 CHAD domain-containing protein [Paludibacterium purpuratum]